MDIISIGEDNDDRKISQWRLTTIRFDIVADEG